MESFRLLGLGGATIRAPRSTYLVGYLASSLVTNMVLTSLIIFRLLLCKSQAENILGSVRLLTIQALIVIAKRLEPSEIRDLLLVQLRASVADKSWRVRYMVANEFVKVRDRRARA